MLSTQRTPQEAKSSPLLNHFEAPFESNLGTIQYTYKKGEALVGLHKKPQTTEEYYQLALTVYNNELALREDSPFFATLSFPTTSEVERLKTMQVQLIQKFMSLFETKKITADDEQQIQEKLQALALQVREQEARNKSKEKFVCSLLFDAAAVGHQGSRVFLAQLMLDPAYAVFREQIKQFFAHQGYHLIQHKANDKGNAPHLNLWSTQPMPSSVAGQEKFLQDLEKGPHGSYYFLQDPNSWQLILTIQRDLVKKNKEKATEWIEEQLINLRQPANIGNLPLVEKQLAILQDLGRQVYTTEEKMERLELLSDNLISFAKRQQSARSKESSLAPQSTREKQPLLAPRPLSANPSSLYAARASSPNQPSCPSDEPTPQALAMK